MPPKKRRGGSLGNKRAKKACANVTFPNPDRNARLSLAKPYPKLTMGHGWATQSMVLRNTHHGGPIETDHNLLVLLPTRACRHWKLAATTVATPTPMSTEINDDIDWYNNCLWSIDLSITKSKDVPAAGIPNTDAYSAQVDRWVKPRTAATPRVGWPAFDTS